MNKGKLICFCGLDGSGKTTQAELLKSYLNKEGLKAKVVHGFKPTVHAGCLKEISEKFNISYYDSFTPQIRFAAYILDMYDKFYNKMEDALNNGYYIICDKYKIESLIYAPLLECDCELVRRLLDIIPDADLSIYMKLTAHEAERRLISRGQDTGEKTGIKCRLDIMQAAKERFDLYCEGNGYIICDASLEKMMLHDQIVKKLEEVSFL